MKNIMNWLILEMLIGSVLIFVGIFGWHWLIVMVGIGLVVSATANMNYVIDSKCIENKYNSKL